jgi:hypothetical protein
MHLRSSLSSSFGWEIGVTISISWTGFSAMPFVFPWEGSQEIHTEITTD